MLVSRRAAIAGAAAAAAGLTEARSAGFEQLDDPTALERIPALRWARQERERRAKSRAEGVVAEGGQLSLRKFIELAWHAVEPSRPYVHGWHIDAICDHLEAVYRGELIRLAIALPPGLMKSLLIAVFFPAWLWGPMGEPSKRIIGFSYETGLSRRDAMKCRRLMQSPWYQQMWGSVFKFSEEQNAKDRYENNQTGFRVSDYVGGGTGERGDVLLIDDPHRVKDPESDAMRQQALLWLHETLPTRTNDPEKTAIVVIHHRLHEQDMIGEILACGMGYEYLCLPMEFEAARRCVTSIGFKDPRTKEGELLFPERFPPAVVERDKIAMGGAESYAWSGQMQQRPAPRGGAMFKRHWFEVVDAAPADCYYVRYWDLASTEGGGAYTAGVLMGRSRSSKLFYVRDVKRAQLDGDRVKQLIRQTAAIDLMELGKKNYAIRLPQDPGQAGKVQAKDYVNLLAGYDVKAELESGDKEVRARPYAAQCEAGNVKLIKGPWINDYLNEAAQFPVTKYKDQVDASSGAFGQLILNPKVQLVVGAVRGLY